MKTLVTAKISRKNMSCIIAGETVKFNAELEAQVEDSVVEKLLKQDPSLSIKGGSKENGKGSDLSDSKKGTEGTDDSSKDNGNNDGKNENSDDNSEMKEELMSMTMNDLKEMVISLPENEWKGLKKKADLVEYIIKNTGK